MLDLKISIDYKRLEKALDEHKGKIRTIAKRCMSKVAVEIKKETKASKLKGQVLKKQSGNLAKKIKYKNLKDGSTVIGAFTYYASWHENGLAGRLPARPFLLPVVQDYFSSNKAQDIADKVLQTALDEIYNGGK